MFALIKNYVKFVKNKMKSFPSYKTNYLTTVRVVDESSVFHVILTGDESYATIKYSEILPR